MRTMDKVFLWGAWGLMAVIGSLSVWRTSQTPKMDPRIESLASEIESLQKAKHTPNPLPQAPVVPVDGGWSRTIAPPAPAQPWAAFVRTEAIGHGLQHPPEVVLVLPSPVMGAAKADLDGTTIAWTLVTKKVPLRKWETQQESLPEALIVERQDDGKTEVLATLGPKATSYRDLSARPGRTYHYSVKVKGTETVPDSDPPHSQAVTKVPEAAAEAKSPRATRLKLVGGDKDNALLRVETYDREQKKWTGKLTQTVPGREVGSSGWTLKGLRFDNFTLMADVVDADGVAAVLTTRQ